MLCCCGQHHHDTQVEEIIAERGETILFSVTSSNIKYKIPRIYIAHHGIRAADAPYLAERYGWEKV